MEYLGICRLLNNSLFGMTVERPDKRHKVVLLPSVSSEFIEEEKMKEDNKVPEFKKSISSEFLGKTFPTTKMISSFDQKPKDCFSFGNYETKIWKKCQQLLKSEEPRGQAQKRKYEDITEEYPAEIQKKK